MSEGRAERSDSNILPIINIQLVAALLALAHTACLQLKTFHSSLAPHRSSPLLTAPHRSSPQPPEDAGKFLRYFKRKTHPSSMLTDKLTFSVLGLGDSNLLLDRQTTTAKDCNACGQLLDRRLEEVRGSEERSTGGAQRRLRGIQQRN